MTSGSQGRFKSRNGSHSAPVPHGGGIGTVSGYELHQWAERSNIYTFYSTNETSFSLRINSSTRAKSHFF